MKGVYEQNPQLGDPTSLEPQISETTQHIGRLRGELAKYEVRAQSVALYLLVSHKLCIWVGIKLTSCFQTWLSEAVGGEESANVINNNAQHV